MKKIYIAIFLLFGIVILSSCEEEVAVKKYYKTEIVGTGNINTNNSYSSYTQWIKETFLSTKSGWKIVFLWKEKWDRVNVWENIASLDWAEAKSWYSTSENVVWLLSNLKNSVVQNYDSQIKSKNELLKKASQELIWISIEKNNTINTDNSEIEIFENKVKETEINLELANKNFIQTENILNEKINQIYSNWTNAITTALILDTGIVNFVDELLWITDNNKDKNDDFEDYLSAKKSSYLKPTIELFKEINLEYGEYKIFYETYIENKKADNEKIIEGLKMWYELAWKNKELLKNVDLILDNSIENISLTQTEINNYKQKIYTFWIDTESNILTISWDFQMWLKGSLNSIELTKKNLTKDLTILKEKIVLVEKQVDIAKNNLEKIKTTNSGNVELIENKKAIWNINISEIQNQIKSLEKEKQTKLKEIDIQIAQNNWNRNIENVHINNTKIVTPYNWIIVEKYLEVWTVISWWTPIFKISNDDTIKLQINLDYKETKNIKIWDTVTVLIEWQKNSFTWAVNNIPLLQDEKSKNTQIEILINNSEHKIKVWTVAKVFINKVTNKWVTIPNKAIISDFMITSVMIIENNISVLKNIKILEQNDSFSLIEWLNPWDILITEWQENIWDQELLN